MLRAGGSSKLTDTIHNHSILMQATRELNYGTTGRANGSTIFVRIVAAATINFSLAWMRLLIEGGFY